MVFISLVKIDDEIIINFFKVTGLNYKWIDLAFLTYLKILKIWKFSLYKIYRYM
jgi:hypothetical protein